MEPEENDNKEIFLKWFSDFKQEREQHKDYWNLAKSSSPELEAMVMTFEQSMSIIDRRITSGKTYGLVFDAKKYRDDTVIDALIKYRICDELSPDEEYNMKIDEYVKMTKVIKVPDKSNEISKILVPASNWPLQRGARLNISNQDYCAFLNQSRKRGHFVDLIILTLNSNMEFDHVDIKLLLKEIKDKQYNIVLLLNDAPKNECTFWKECDKCYANLRYSLSALNVPTDDRFIKISAKTTLENNIPRKPMDISFEKVVKLIKEELTMDNVIGRYLKDAQLFMNNFDEVKKMIRNIKEKVENDASSCEKKLQEKKIETQKTIDDSKNATECLLVKKIKTKTDKVDNIDLKFVKENVDPIIDDSFKNFRKQFKKQIRVMIQTNNPKLESYITEMYFSQYKEEGYEIHLKTTIQECLKEVLEESKNCNTKVKTVLECFLEKTKGHVAKTFGKINSSFENFRDNLKEKVVDKFEKFEKTMESITENFTECLKKDLTDKLQKELPIIDGRIAEMERLIGCTITKVTKEINDEIMKKKDINICPKYITDFLDVENIAVETSNAIDGILSEFKDTIVTMISSIGSDPHTKKWINNIIVLIQDRIFKRSFCEDFKRLPVEAFHKLDLSNDDLYSPSESHAFVLGCLKDIIYPDRGELSTMECNELEKHSSYLQRNRRNSRIDLTKYKFIKEKMMREQVKKLEEVLQEKFHLKMTFISETLRTCLNTKAWHD